MKNLFLLDLSLVFLNHGSFGACPAAVFATYQEWQRELERNPVDFLGRRSGQLLAESRAVLARYLGAQPAYLVYLATGANTVDRSLSLASGDEILTTDHRARVWRLHVHLGTRVCALTGMASVCGDADFGQMVVIPIPPTDAQALGRRLLKEYGIEVPVTEHRERQFVRISVQGYNTQGDLDTLVDALQKIYRAAHTTA